MLQVFLECGHGGVCFSCAIDTYVSRMHTRCILVYRASNFDVFTSFLFRCVVTGKCLLCRNSIEQIVTVAASGTVKWNGKNDEGLVESIAVIGPT